jgi:hypothetical protein
MIKRHDRNYPVNHLRKYGILRPVVKPQPPQKKETYYLSRNNQDNFLLTDINDSSIFENVNKIKLSINGEDIIFKKVDKKDGYSGYTSFYFIDDEKKYFMKIPRRCLDYDIMKREIFILKKLENYDRFPKVIFHDNFCVVFDHIGEVIKKETIPIDVIFQINDINNILKKEKITHTDVKVGEMLVKNNRLYLADFGWAKYNNSITCNQGFSNKEKPYLDTKTDIHNMLNVIIRLLNDEI